MERFGRLMWAALIPAASGARNKVFHVSHTHTHLRLRDVTGTAVTAGACLAPGVPWSGTLSLVGACCLAK